MGIHVAILFILPVLVIVASTDCEEDSDCAADECCISLGIWWPTSVCSKYLKEGETCFESEEDMKRYFGGYYGSCPCLDGLICQVDADWDIPFFRRLGFYTKCSKKDNSTDATTDVSVTSEKVIEE